MSEEINTLLKKINEKLDIVLENFDCSETDTKDQTKEDPNQINFSWYDNTIKEE